MSAGGLSRPGSRPASACSSVTGHRSPVTGHRSPVTGHRSPVTGPLWTTGRARPGRRRWRASTVRTATARTTAQPDGVPARRRRVPLIRRVVARVLPVAVATVAAVAIGRWNGTPPVRSFGLFYGVQAQELVAMVALPVLAWTLLAPTAALAYRVGLPLLAPLAGW